MSVAPHPDDRVLLEAFCARRSEDAFAALVRRYLPLVMQVARRRVGSWAVAEEVAQITFSLLAAKAGTVARHPERLKAWLCRTAYLTAKNHARKEERLGRIPLSPEEHSAIQVQSELHERLDAASNRLPELDRELVLRHCCGGEEYREIASAVGKSAAACQKRVERALAVLGKSVGGAKTAGVALAAMATAMAKSEAMPVSGRIVSLAMQKKSSAAGFAVGGAVGLKIAACGILAAAGGMAGWDPPEMRTVSENLRTTSTARLQVRNGAGNVAATSDGLAPRSLPVSRTLTEVLESVQAQRLGPLVEFLPTASVSDLQAVIAEDDIANFGEGSGSSRAAHALAVKRWAEIDAAGAFAYGQARDEEGGNYGAGTVSILVFQTWMKNDPEGALGVYRGLVRRYRETLGESLAQMRADLADRFAEMDEELAWYIAAARVRQGEYASFQNFSADEAREVIAEFLLTENPAELSRRKVEFLMKAFQTLVAQDPAGALAEADAFPPGPLQTSILLEIYKKHPPEAYGLPPGQMRVFALSREAMELATADLDAATERLQSATEGDRGVFAAAISRRLAASDPWRLLELAASEPQLFGTHAYGVLETAARSDPQRALGLARKIVRGVAADPRPYMKQVVSGWLEKDPAAALRWAMAANLDFSDYKDNELLRSVTNLEPIVELLDDPDERLGSLAFRMLSEGLEGEMGADDLQRLLEGIPPRHVNQLLLSLAVDEFQRGRYERGMMIAALSSETATRRELFRRMMLSSRCDPEAVSVMLTLPEVDRKHLAEDLKQWLDENPDAKNVDQIKGAIERVKP